MINEKFQSDSFQRKKQNSMNESQEIRSVYSLDSANSGLVEFHEESNINNIEVSTGIFPNFLEMELPKISENEINKLSTSKKEIVLFDAYKRKEEGLLDPNHAEFAESSDPQVKSVVTPEDRNPVNDTTAYPFRSICKLYITARDGAQFIGTGFYIGPNCVLTAGHCVWFRGGWAKRIEVIPGLNKEPNRPFQQTNSNDFVCLEGWRQSGDQAYDVAAIFTPRAYGDELGFLGFSPLSDEELQGLRVTVCGYSGDKPDDAPGEAQFYHTDAIIGVELNILKYLNDTEKGASGAPIMYSKNNKISICGVHNNGIEGNRITNSGTRITPNIFDIIRGWKYRRPLPT